MLSVIILLLFYSIWLCRNHPMPAREIIVSSRGEERCRIWLENHFGRPFIRVRPDWLRNPRFNKNLELDCYNEELKLAVEYNGAQHYKYTPKFHRKKGDLAYSRFKDKLKADLCRQHDVHLIVVPYSEEDIESFLERQVKKWHDFET